MTLAMTKQEREAFLAEVGWNISVADTKNQRDSILTTGQFCLFHHIK